MSSQGEVIQFPKMKICADDFDVLFETGIVLEKEISPQLEVVKRGLREINDALEQNDEDLHVLNSQLDQLTNQADGLDYMLAAGSGILAGFIDVFWVGKFDMEQGKAWSNEKVNRFVEEMAKKKGWGGEGRLKGAISYLEGEFKIPSDNIWKGKEVNISAKSHHLDDLAHHPTLLGLICSILTQFTKTGYFQNGEGDFLSIAIDETSHELIGKDIVSKILCGTVNWFFHLVSDMSGSNKTAGAGMGIPGPFISLLKEISLIPGLNKADLPKKVKKAFVEQRFDLRSEMAVGHEVGRQAMPVILNEVIVRGFYLIRKLFLEIKQNGIEQIDWKNVLPVKNRTIVRMLTIATGTFTMIDLCDAAIRGGLKSGGEPANFAKEFLLHVNFVGVGRFSIAVTTDLLMGNKKNKVEYERIALMNEQLHLLNAKTFYQQADMWQAAANTETGILEAISCMRQTKLISMIAWVENIESLHRIGQYRQGILQHNAELIDDIDDILTWG